MILHAWLRWRIGKDFGREEGGSDDEVEEVMRFELRCVSEFLGLGHHGGAMDGGEEALDAEEEALGIARKPAIGEQRDVLAQTLADQSAGNPQHFAHAGAAAWTFIADDDDVAARDAVFLDGGKCIFLTFEDAGRAFEVSV